MINKVIVITGPTAIGKTDISLQIAKHYNGDIINADASQFRRGLNVGTAKIDLKKVEIPHHLIDIIDIEDDFSIKDYQELARNIINEMHSNDKFPFLVGGSGLYINSVIGNYELDDTVRNTELEDQYLEFDNLSLHEELRKYDYEASLKIHPNNRRRVIRAIQKAKEGPKISELNSGNNLVYDVLIIQLTTLRDILYSRINKRYNIMINDGWLEEVKDLKVKGIDFSKIKDIGYNELSLYLDGVNSFEFYSEEIKKKTRNYAKRQITWFKNKMDTVAVEMDYQNIKNTVNEIIKNIDTFLKA